MVICTTSEVHAGGYAPAVNLRAAAVEGFELPMFSRAAGDRHVVAGVAVLLSAKTWMSCVLASLSMTCVISRQRLVVSRRPQANRLLGAAIDWLTLDASHRQAGQHATHQSSPDKPKRQLGYYVLSPAAR